MEDPTVNHMARLATEKEAAEAVGVDLATFRAWVACGRLPKPIADCDKFDLRALISSTLAETRDRGGHK
jgi:hypothetical protein